MSFFTRTTVGLNQTNSLDLQSQIEELNTKLREDAQIMKDKEFKYLMKFDEYEATIQKVNEENRLLKEKYDKIFEAHRKMQKNDNILEEKLLSVVDRYEAQCKQLKDDLEASQAKLVEAKLIMNDLEHEKQRYKQDCNLAVNLLQCRPNEFVNHTINTLPLNLKERLSNHLSHEEMHKLEVAADLEKEQEEKALRTNSIFKIPTFQPTAAAAIMYNMQTVSLKQQKRLSDETTNNDATIYNRSVSLTQTQSTSTQSLNNELNKSTMSLTSTDGTVPTSLLAKILQKDNHIRPKLFPFVCTRCKKDIWMCDTSTQTIENVDDDQNSKILYPNKNSNMSSFFNRSKSVANHLFEFNNDNNNSKLDIHEENETKTTELRSKGNRKKLDSWTDVDVNAINYK